jgi:hypothetical protein
MSCLDVVAAPCNRDTPRRRREHGMDRQQDGSGAAAAAAARWTADLSFFSFFDSRTRRIQGVAVPSRGGDEAAGF